MATIYWLGTAQAVAQITTVQVTAYDAATTYKLTINGKVISTIAQGSVALTATDLANKWAASVEPECLEATASAATDTVTLTGNTAGVPFTVASSVSGGTGTIGSATTGTSASGPNFWSTAANWSGAAVPVNSDTVYIEGVVPILYGLGQSAVTLTALYVQNFSATIGLPPRNANGYAEYRTQSLQIGSTTIILQATNQSGMIRLDTGSVQTAITVLNTGTALDALIPAFSFIGTHASNVVNHQVGDMGAAVRPGEVATILTLRVGNGQGSVPTFYGGIGLTLATLKQASGDTKTFNNVTTATIDGGTLTHKQTATMTTANVRFDGTMIYESTGTLTTLNAGTGGSVTFSHLARTVTTTLAYAGCAIKDANKNTTFTNGIALQQCRVSDISLDVGPGVTLTPA